MTKERTSMFKAETDDMNAKQAKSILQRLESDEQRCRGTGVMGGRILCQGCIDCDWIATRYRNEVRQRIEDLETLEE